jgi:Na+/H+-translocating membrane pyrophosphatase
LSECASGARFRITAGKEVQKQEATAVERITLIQDEISEKGVEETTATAIKPKASFQIVKVTVALFFVPMMGAALGFLLGGPLGATAGAISCYAIVVALSLAFFVLSSKRSRTL